MAGSNNSLSELDTGAIRDGLNALLTASRADAADRRAWVGVAASRIASAYGQPQFYDFGDDMPESLVFRAIDAVARDMPLERWIMATLLVMANVDDSGKRTLFRSVLRPLAELQGATATEPTKAIDNIISYMAKPNSAAGVALDNLRSELIAASTSPNTHPAAIEAAAALIRLDPESAPAQDDTEPPVLRIGRDGPYLLTGAVEVTDHLGVPVPRNGPVAFCRCGRSATKPFCDGSHVEAGFTGEKDPRRVPDQRDTYAGQQATVFDNRGLCAHSGFCTDRLNGVFHLGEEPFVTPSGARLDEIIDAVRRCPSGALSYGLDRQEDRAHVDQPRPAAIEISKDGPYRITGAIRLIDDTGGPVARPEGASMEHYSLCRCGSSLNKPFCSGMHWSIAFADPMSDPAAEPTLFEWAGGYPALLDMTRIFYSRHVPADPIVGPLFAMMAPDHPERVAAWLSEVFGGPKFYSERYGGYSRMISEHLDKHLTREQRAHWARLMVQSADEAGLPDDAEFRAAFTGYIEWGSRIALKNSQSGAKPPPNMPVPQWWWVCNASPGSRMSTFAPESDAPADAEAPALVPGERPSFASHILPLFRTSDRASMRFAFDLWSHEDVRTHADAILGRVRAGTMPCDMAWASGKVELFAQWVNEGCDP